MEVGILSQRQEMTYDDLLLMINTRMGGHGGTEKVGDLLIGDDYRIFHVLGKGAKGAAQHNADLRGKTDLFAHIFSAFGEIFVSVVHNNPPICSIPIVPRPINPVNFR